MAIRGDYRRGGLGRRDYRTAGQPRSATQETTGPIISPYAEDYTVPGKGFGVVNLSLSLKIKSTQQDISFSFGLRR